MPIRISKNRLHVDVPTALQGPVNYAAATGTDTYTADISPVFTAYVTGAHYFISFTNANTSTTPTININSLGAKTIVKEGTTALAAGDIPAGHKGILMYDGTYLVLMNPKGVTVIDQSLSNYMDIGSTRLQWGSVNVTVSGSQEFNTTDISFPAPFKTGTTPSFTATMSGIADSNHFNIGIANTLSNTQFDLGGRDLVTTRTGTYTIYWQAIGLKP